MGTNNSYRDVPMCPVDAMHAASGFLAREWGENYRLGFAGSLAHNGTYVYIFQCRASDGSRFLIGSDRWGNCEHITGVDVDRIGDLLDVEVYA